MEPRIDPSRRLGALLCSGLFLALIYAPLADQLVRPAYARDVRNEFRVAAARPELALDLASLESFPKAFEAWHGDTFGLRDKLLRWHNMLRWFALKSAPSERIVLGAQDWIFSRFNSALSDHRGALPLSTAELELWRVLLERRSAFLAERGIDFRFVVAPNKNQVYPELVPPRFAPIGPTRLDQLTRWLPERSDARVLDLRPALRAERANDRGDDLTYFPLGTHWTERGAYAAYAAVLGSLAGGSGVGAPLERSAFDVAPRGDDGDSWGGRLYMADLLRQANLGWTVREPRARMVEGELGSAFERFERPDATALPRALFLHDSFGLPLRPWLAEHFRELDCRWTTDFDAEEIEAERPDVVIQLYVESTLMSLAPQPTLLEDRGATAERFAACPLVLWRFSGSPGESGLDSDSKLAYEGQSLLVMRERSDELLYLPELDYPRDHSLILCLEVESEQPGPLQVFFQTEDQRSYDRSRTVQGRLGRGHSEVYFVLPPLGVAGRLAVRVGSEAGTYRVGRIELRAASG